MTLSIVGRCAQTGQLGIAVSSSSIAVGARCPWLRAGVGAVSTQNITLPALGSRILDRLSQGETAQQALQSGLASDDFLIIASLRCWRPTAAVPALAERTRWGESRAVRQRLRGGR